MRIIKHYGHKTLWTVRVEVCKYRVCGYSFLVATGVSLGVSIQASRCWSQISFHNRRWKCSICFGTVSNWCFRTKWFTILMNRCLWSGYSGLIWLCTSWDCFKQQLLLGNFLNFFHLPRVSVSPFTWDGPDVTCTNETLLWNLANSQQPGSFIF